jgi:hypothetical protein
MSQKRISKVTPLRTPLKNPSGQDRLAALAQGREGPARPAAQEEIVVLKARIEGDTVEIVGFDSDITQPEIICGILGTAIARCAAMGKPGPIAWPLWVHYTTGFISNIISQAMNGELQAFGIQPETIALYLEKNRERLPGMVQKAFADLAKKQHSDNLKGGKQ